MPSLIRAIHTFRYKNVLLMVFVLLVLPGVVWGQVTAQFQNSMTTVGAAAFAGSHNPGGVAVAVDGTVYVAETVTIPAAGSQLQVLVVPPGGGTPYLIQPLVAGLPVFGTGSGIALYDDGSGSGLQIYLADPDNNRVLQMSLSGTATVVDTLAIVLSGPKGVAVDSTGLLYIADTGNNRIIVAVNGILASDLGVAFSPSLNLPSGLAFDAADNLYIADSSNNRIMMVTPARVSSWVTYSCPVGPCTMTSPQAVAVGKDGTIYVAPTTGVYGGAPVSISPTRVFTAVPVGAARPGASRGVAVNGLGDIYFTDNAAGDTYLLQAYKDFGTIVLGGAATTLPIEFTVQNFTVANGADVSAYTMGASALDFNVVTDGCTGAPSDCVINVSFQPTGPGLREGALVLSSTNGVLSIAPLRGKGDASLSTFSPGMGTSIAPPDPATLNGPVQVATDAAGTVYIANSLAQNVVKIKAGGATTVITAGGILGTVGGVALDGAGNLFISDKTNSVIVEITPAAAISTLTVTAGGVGLSSPGGLAVDFAGNLYIADTGNSRVVQVKLPIGGGGAISLSGLVVNTGSLTLGAQIDTVAVDAAGTVYIADPANNRIVKVTASGVAAALAAPSHAIPLAAPQGVAVDAMGNIFIADTGDDQILMLASGVNEVGVAVPTLTPAVTNAVGVAADSAGRLYVLDSNNRVVKLDMTAPNAATFGNQMVHTTSTPQTVVLTNLGTKGLQILSVAGYNADFPENVGDAGIPGLCDVVVGLLNQGANCAASAKFSPTVRGVRTTTVNIRDTSLEGSPTHSWLLSGTGIDLTRTTVTLPASANSGQSFTISVTVTDMTGVGVPTGGVTLTDTLGANLVALNGGVAVPLVAGVATLNAALSGSGTHTIDATYQGDTGFGGSSGSSDMLVADLTSVTVTATPASVISGGTVNLRATVADTSAPAVVPVGGVTFVDTYTGVTLNGGAPVPLVAGVATLNSVTMTGAATHPIAGHFVDPAGNFANSSGTFNVTVNPAVSTPTVTLATSAANVLLQNMVTLTATVSSAVGGGVPTGTVTFLEGATTLGTGTLDGSGVATLAISSLTAGAHSITARYAGDSNYFAASSTAINQNVQDLQLAITNPGSGGPMAGYVADGGTVTFGFQFAPTNGPTFPSTVTLCVTGAPAGSTVTLSPSSLLAGSGAQAVSVQIQTVPGSAGLFGSRSPILAAGLLPLLGLLGWRKRVRRSLLMISLLSLMVVLVTAGCIPGKSTSSSSSGGSSKTYTMQLTATSGNLQRSTTFNLTVVK